MRTQTVQPQTGGTAPAYIVTYSNHFDLIWRRGWQRGYEYRGLYYRPYADVEEAIISRCIELAETEGASFMVEQALSIREYLRRHPQAQSILKRLVREGRFELAGSGEAIIDLNMCGGETMVRNLASGVVYARDVLGQGIDLACHSDGFGSSAQFPQVARGCGLRGINSLSYCTPDAPYWRGLDGSTVLTSFPRSGAFFFYDHCYYEPCLNCRGHGSRDGAACAPCEATGLRLSQGTYPERPWADSEYAAPKTSTVPFVGSYLVCSEEMMPDAQLPEMVRQRNAQGAEQYHWRTQQALMPLWEAALNRVDDDDIAVSSRLENNPVQSGCLVSRIRVKQAARRAESIYYAAEKLVALWAVTNPEAPAPTALAAFEAAWRGLPLLHFHDAVTGTHIDPAHDELLDVARDIEAIAIDTAAASCGCRPVIEWSGDGELAVWNPHGHTASLVVELPARGAAFSIEDAAGRPVPVYAQPSDEEPPIVYDISPVVPPAVGQGHWQKMGLQPPKVLRFLADDVPPLSLKTFSVRQCRAIPAQQAADSFTLGDYTLGFNDFGVTSIRHHESGADESGVDESGVDESGVDESGVDESGAELLGDAVAGHLLVEEDIGDPWGTRELRRGRRSCAAMSRCLGARVNLDVAEVAFAGRFDNNTFGRESDTSVFGLEWKQTVRLLRGTPYVEFEFEIFWQTVNRRLRAVFPSLSHTDTGLYSIPCGVLERERYEQTETALWSPNGDWPALHFVASMPHGDVPGLAIFNQGMPSARIEDGNVMVSLLRSPGFGHCLTRPAQEYPMPIDGIRDGGYHRFRLFVMPHTASNLPQLLRVGHELNQQALAFDRVGNLPADWRSGLSVQGEGVSVACVKNAFTNRGLVVRLVEETGMARCATLNLPAGVNSVHTTNMLEDTVEELPVHDRQVALEMRAFDIVTLLLH